MEAMAVRGVMIDLDGIDCIDSSVLCLVLVACDKAAAAEKASMLAPEPSRCWNTQL